MNLRKRFRFLFKINYDIDGSYEKISWITENIRSKKTLTGFAIVTYMGIRKSSEPYRIRDFIRLNVHHKDQPDYFPNFLDVAKIEVINETFNGKRGLYFMFMTSKIHDQVNMGMTVTKTKHVTSQFNTSMFIYNVNIKVTKIKPYSFEDYSEANEVKSLINNLNPIVRVTNNETVIINKTLSLTEEQYHSLKPYLRMMDYHEIRTELRKTNILRANRKRERLGLV